MWLCVLYCCHGVRVNSTVTHHSTRHHCLPHRPSHHICTTAAVAVARLTVSCGVSFTLMPLTACLGFTHDNVIKCIARWLAKYLCPAYKSVSRPSGQKFVQNCVTYTWACRYCARLWLSWRVKWMMDLLSSLQARIHHMKLSLCCICLEDSRSVGD